MKKEFLNVSQLVIGNYYKYDTNYEGRPASLIFRYSGDLRGKNHYINLINIYAFGACGDVGCKTFYLAPMEDILWLAACTDANKTVERPKCNTIIENYSIY